MDGWAGGWFDGCRKQEDTQQKTDGKMDIKVGRCRRVGAGGEDHGRGVAAEVTDQMMRQPGGGKIQAE